MYISDRYFSRGSRVYSVSLTESEYRLFSEFQKEFGFFGNLAGSIRGSVGSAWNGLMKNRSMGIATKAANQGMLNKSSDYLGNAVLHENRQLAANRLRNISNARLQGNINQGVNAVRSGAQSVGNAFAKAGQMALGGLSLGAQKVGNAAKSAYQSGVNTYQNVATGTKNLAGRGMVSLGTGIAKMGQGITGVGKNIGMTGALMQTPPRQ